MALTLSKAFKDMLCTSLKLKPVQQERVRIFLVTLLLDVFKDATTINEVASGIAKNISFSINGRSLLAEVRDSRWRQTYLSLKRGNTTFGGIPDLDAKLFAIAYS